MEIAARKQAWRSFSTRRTAQHDSYQRGAHVLACLASVACLVTTSACKNRPPTPHEIDGQDSDAAPAITLTAMEFATFSLAVPAGAGNKVLDKPDIGRYEVAQPGGRDGWIHLEWEPGPARTLAELAAARDAAARLAGRVVHDESVTIDGVSGVLSLVELGNLPGHPPGVQGFMGLGLLQCPGHAIQISLASWIDGSKQESLALHRGMATSLACKPAPQSRPDKPPAITMPAFDPPAGFGYLPGSSPPTFLGVDESFYTFERAPLHPSEPLDEIRAKLEQWAEREELELLDVDLWDTVHDGLGKTPTRVIMARLRSADSDRFTLFLGLFDCKLSSPPDDGSSDSGVSDGSRNSSSSAGISFSVRYLAGPDTTRDTGVARLTRAGCPGEEPIDTSAFATVRDVFDRACKKRNGHACKLLADLLASGEVEMAGVTPDKLYARACQLGFAAACP